MLGYQHTPGELVLGEPHPSGNFPLPKTRTLHDAGGRLSRSLLESFSAEIDAFFGKPVTRHLHPSRTLDVATACRHCGRPRDVSARVAEENPFCAECLPERISRRAAAMEYPMNKTEPTKGPHAWPIITRRDRARDAIEAIERQAAAEATLRPGYAPPPGISLHHWRAMLERVRALGDVPDLDALAEFVGGRLLGMCDACGRHVDVVARLEQHESQFDICLPCAESVTAQLRAAQEKKT